MLQNILNVSLQMHTWCLYQKPTQAFQVITRNGTMKRIEEFSQETGIKHHMLGVRFRGRPAYITIASLGCKFHLGQYSTLIDKSSALTLLKLSPESLDTLFKTLVEIHNACAALNSTLAEWGLDETEGNGMLQDLVPVLLEATGRTECEAGQP